MAARARAVKHNDRKRLLDHLAQLGALARSAQKDGDRAKQLSALRAAAKIEQLIALLEHRAPEPEPANYAPVAAPDGTHRCGRCGAPCEIGLVVRYESPQAQFTQAVREALGYPSSYAPVDWSGLEMQMRHAWETNAEQFAAILMRLPGLAETEIPKGADHELTGADSRSGAEENAQGATGDGEL